VYALAILATAAFKVFRPAHSALLPALCVTPLELTSANVVRGLVDSVSTLVGPLLAALLLDVGSPAAVFGAAAALALASGGRLLRLSYEAAPRAERRSHCGGSCRKRQRAFARSCAWQHTSATPASLPVRRSSTRAITAIAST